jgi:hypothetical protein
MTAYKVENPKFKKSEDLDFTSCSFVVNGQTYWLPTDDQIKPSFLIRGQIPIGTEGDLDPSMVDSGRNLTEDLRIVRLAYIHFLENYYDRVTESKPVPDNLSLRELAEFWVRNHFEDVDDYGNWLKLIKKIWNIRISD